ncbi:MAG: T9SS type A sorting domain-containing protein [Candidatus Kapaibacterium sp.]
MAAILNVFSASESAAQWQKIIPYCNGFCLVAISPDSLMYIQAGNVGDYSLKTSTDGGITWDSSQIGYCFTDHPRGFLPSHIQASSLDDVYVEGYVDSVFYDPGWASENYPAIRHTTDRGKTWKDFVTLPSGLWNQGSYSGLKLLPSGALVYGAGSGGWHVDSLYLLRKDGSRTAMIGGSSSSLGFFDFRDENLGMMWLNGSNLIRTRDGVHWDTVLNRRTSFGGICYLHGSTWIAEVDSVCLTSTNDGDTWQETQRNPYYYGGAFAYSSRGFGFLVSIFGARSFYGTWNGIDWLSIPTPDSTSNDILSVASKNVIYYRASLAMYRSDMWDLLGVDNSKEQISSELSVVPNPARGKTNVEFAPSDHPRTLSVFDMLGRTVASFTVEPGLTQLPMELTTGGIYTIKLENIIQRVAVER